MVSKFPTPEMVTPEDRERLQAKVAETVEEDVVEDAYQPSPNGVADSIADLKSKGFRYTDRPIFGFEKKVRFRSLTARQFEATATEADKNILLYSMVKGSGEMFFGDLEELNAWIDDDLDARTYAELLSAANMHCLGRGGLDQMIEDSAGN